MKSSSKQYTTSWWEERRGKFTASQVWKLLDPERRRELICEIVAERIGLPPATQKVRFAGSWGHRYEPIARALFVQQTGLKVQETGFINAVDPELQGWLGASPDGMGEDFGIEIKALSKPKHIRFIDSGHIEPKYIIQIATQMLVTKAPTWYYVSFHPDHEQNLAFKALSWVDMAKTISTVQEAVIEAIKDVKAEMKEWGGVQ